MEKSNAQIHEINEGPYYNIKLNFLPHVGETIVLYSNLDASTEHSPNHRYQVVSIEHQITDVTDKKKGSHTAIINVKPL